MNKKSIYIINAVAILVMIVLAAVYAHVGNPYVFKSLASGWFILMGIFNFVVATKIKNTPKIYRLLMLIGLIFAAAGDIFLIEDSTFVLGAGLFAIGHVFYFVSFLLLQKLRWFDYVIFAVLVLICSLVIFLYNGFNFNGMLPIIVVYAVIISAMLAKAIGNAITNNFTLQNVFVALGALLFFISDLCLLFYVFAGADIWVDNACLYTYYLGQAILASSLYYVNQQKKEKGE